MERPQMKSAPPRYISTTMSTNRTLKERWINGFKLAFFASVLFGLVGLPFSLAQDGIGHLLKGQGGQVTLTVWLLYLLVALLTYPILFDWLAAVFRIQFVRKAILRPIHARAPKVDLSPQDPPPPESPRS
jgi:H+/Cl- antiporter ClcA